MKKNFLKLFIVFTFFGCEEMSTVIDIDLPEHNPLLVVNSVPEIKDYVRVYISHSLDPLSNNQYKFLDDATVLLKYDNIIDTALFVQSSSEEPCYYNVPNLIEGKTYTLEAYHHDYPTANSTISVPFGVAIENVQVDSLYENRILLNFSIIDPIEENYYYLRFTIKQNGKWKTTAFESSDPSFDDRGLIDDGQISGRKILFNDQLFNNSKKSFDVNLIIKNNDSDDQFSLDNDNINLSIDSVKIHFFTITESYYKYHLSRKMQDRNENNPLNNLLGTEPVVVYNNINNGYGVFGVRVKKDTVIPINY
ncbi:MAG: hypothetical protein CMD04_05630 [Flavobacteriales bacterium]|nr:hypothetical protein [Flavobacteriales bacterium]